MKLGKLDFKDAAAQKPIVFGARGELLSTTEFVRRRSSLPIIGSLHTLPLDQQIRLTQERYKLEPDFKLGIVDLGVLSKAEVLEHVAKQTDFGKMAVQAEMEYCNQLMTELTLTTVPAWPKMIKGIDMKLPDWKPVQNCVCLKLANRVLFCENTTDGVTAPIAAYRIANVHPAFGARGFILQVLTGADDVRANFVPKAKNALTVFIDGVGHGNAGLYTGNGGNHILEVGAYDPAEVAGKSLHFLSCQTAAQLGPDTVAHGAASYCGYTENFTFVWDDPGTAAVNEFELFMKADSTYPIMMANGATSQQAWDATIAAFTAARALVPGSAAATWLTWDRDHCARLGAAATTIQPFRYVKICFPIWNMAVQDALLSSGQLVE